jgi:hypothetical protein
MCKNITGWESSKRFITGKSMTPLGVANFDPRALIEQTW